MEVRMRSTLRPTSTGGGGIFFEYYREPCPICQKTGGCMIHKDGNMVVCIRVESNRPFGKHGAAPGYVHFLKGRDIRKIDTSDIVTFQSEPKKSPAELDRVFSAMIDLCPLREEHFQHLTAPSRGLTKDQIIIRGYRSFPTKPWTLVKALETEYSLSGEDLIGVPGFYEAEGKFGKYVSLKGVKESFLIPFRNEYNQIVGFQTRNDHKRNDVVVKIKKEGFDARIKEQPNLVQVFFKGQVVWEGEINDEPKSFDINGQTPKSFEDVAGIVHVKEGSRYFWLSSANLPRGTASGDPPPVHVAVPTSRLKAWKKGELMKAKAVWLSEGPLKCDIASDLIEKMYDPEELESLGTTFLALPGVGSWRLVLPMLKKMGVKIVNLCFDADAASNEQVKTHLINCAKELKKMDLIINVVLWNEKADQSKGIDDLLLSKRYPKINRLI